MSNRYDRRTFLRRGAEGLGAAAAIGMGGIPLESHGHLSAPALSRAAAPKPKRGGTMTIGTWSEVNGLSPPTARWDATGYLYGNALFDTLIQIGADGRVHPYLASAFSHNAANTIWTFEIRKDVVFHNGEACDAQAVANSLNAAKEGFVTALAMKPVEKIEAIGDRNVKITLSQPWPAFASYLAGQLGYICAPAMLKSANQGALNPIGTGPYLFVDWEPNSHLNTKRNPHYWRSGYPYLDELNFKPLPDNTERADALLAHTINVMHCQAPRTIKPFFGNKSFQVIRGTLPPRAESDCDFIMLNLDSPPLGDVTLRKALAMAIDRTVYRETYGDDLITPITGPFIPGEVWYTATGYPKYDPKQAKKLVEEYKKKSGNANPEIKLTTITGPQYAEICEIVQQEWEGIGVKTTVGSVDFTAFVTDSVVGDFQACTYEQFGATDPDQNYIWWSTDTYAPVGQVSLNMARNRDSRIQKYLNIGRESTDLDVRADAYKQVSKYLADDLPYLWLGKTYWAAVAGKDVTGVNGQLLPGDVKSIGFNNGAFLVHQLAFTK